MLQNSFNKLQQQDWVYHNRFGVDWPSSFCEAERSERAREKQPNVL